MVSVLFLARQGEEDSSRNELPPFVPLNLELLDSALMSSCCQVHNEAGHRFGPDVPKLAFDEFVRGLGGFSNYPMTASFAT